jgi:hypothetical protein
MSEVALASGTSIVTAGTLLVAAGSLLVLFVTSFFMVLESVRRITALCAQPIAAILRWLYRERALPLLRVPPRHPALRWPLVALIILTPAFPPIAIEEWVPRTIAGVLRAVSGAASTLYESVPVPGTPKGTRRAVE